MAAPAGTGDQQQPGSTPGKKEDFDYENFDWVALTKEIRSSPETGKAYVETDWEKFQRKFGDNPLVPIGCAVTTACLVSGIISFMSKRSAMSQTMMRARVAAQGFTVFALLGGVILNMKKKND